MVKQIRSRDVPMLCRVLNRPKSRLASASGSMGAVETDAMPGSTTVVDCLTERVDCIVFLPLRALTRVITRL